VPVLINTSFNEQEPIVARPEEAIACFKRTDMDVLVLGNCYVTRHASAALAAPASAEIHALQPRPPRAEPRADAAPPASRTCDMPSE
jgi:Carbamoyltransferase C-terminus